MDFLADNDAVFVVPTDTVYGLCCRVASVAGTERLYQLKGREGGKACIVLAQSLDEIRALGCAVERLPEYHEPTSFVVPCQPVYAHMHTDNGTLAFRIPLVGDIVEILKKTGPLLAPSANPNGMQPARTVAEARAYFGDAVDGYIDGGTLDASPSRIISLLTEPPTVVR